MKRLYATASIVSAGRIAFTITSIDCRLVVSADFEKGIVWIKCTHRRSARSGGLSASTRTRRFQAQA
ncbi:type II toxin-antitoxin system HigB family toxin [Aureimonas altamirensis]|uniref:type II toxin-antitoxin system HigB family toxin n=1 Tax=Aureimonas altamirensis TaxID=370622 RepID=UPI0009DEDFDB|nr:type II toxin-antitoxin system HigB family toxin [Aureimonas altamirensis]